MSFVVEGLRLLKDAADSSVRIQKLYFTESFGKKHSDELQQLTQCADEVLEISENVASRLSETKSPQGVFGLCKIKNSGLNEEDVINGGRYLMLQNVQDPSNLGAAARSAEALGISGLIVSGGCDIYSPKALRASMGAFFRLPVMLPEDAESFVQNVSKRGVQVFACVPDRDAFDIRKLDFSKPCVAVIGNEGNGITGSLINKCTHRITIPMPGRAESLNASHAASIVMWEMMRNG